MRAVSLALAILFVSCGGGGSNGGTSPTPTIPSVSGTYTGTATFAFPELNQSLPCPASTSVTQSGASVNIAPVILRGDCGNISIPVGSATIDATGALGAGSATGTYNEPSCGTYTYAGSGGFFGRELRISIAMSSATCYNINFTAVLTR